MENGYEDTIKVAVPLAPRLPEADDEEDGKGEEEEKRKEESGEAENPYKFIRDTPLNNTNSNTNNNFQKFLKFFLPEKGNQISFTISINLIHIALFPDKKKGFMTTQ